MRRARPLPTAGAAALALAPFLAAAASAADTTYQVVTPKNTEVTATGLNGVGDIVGFTWVEEKERPGVVEQKPIFARGKEVTFLPVLPTYTATFPAGVADDGTVVGRSSKPAPMGGPRVMLRNQAFVWDAKAGIRPLGALPDDWASFATGVSRDGRRIAGFSVGDNRMRACVWDRDDKGGWKGAPLPHDQGLRSNTVAISPDGRLVAAADGVSACLWTRQADGTWAREVVAGNASLIPRAVNDRGTVVGLRHEGDGNTHAVWWSREGGYKKLDEPAGYTRSEANGVNNAGAVVGMIDGPHGSKVTPKGFVIEGGKLRILTEGGPNFTGAVAVNDKNQVAGVFEEEEAPPAEPAEAPAAAKGK